MVANFVLLLGNIVCKTAEAVRMRGKQVAQWLVGP